MVGGREHLGPGHGDLGGLARPASAIELVDGKVTRTAKELEQMTSCQALGGCFVVTRAALEAMVETTIDATLVEVAKSAPICKRGQSI